MPEAGPSNVASSLSRSARPASRIRVQTEVLIAPVHNTATLAKQTAALDRMLQRQSVRRRMEQISGASW